MNRYFRMIDTLDTLPQRIVVNMGTSTNIKQAIAENVCPKLTPEQRVEHAKQKHSDYAEWLWVRVFDPGAMFKIHIESGRIEFNNKAYHCDAPWQDIKANELTESKYVWPQMNMTGQSHHGVIFTQQRYRVTNTEVNPEYFNRSIINREIRMTFVILPSELGLVTSSRNCRFSFDLDQVHMNNDLYKGWIGANVRQSDDNILDHLEQVID